ncbi:MAG: tetratricopeptide repeat protein [Deltaproteobacteria bacterium]|nr:tetratricopeptide repeat protein [Deltaproteobacteria bacterium]
MKPRFLLLLAFSLLMLPGPCARADGFKLGGRWWTPLGVLRIEQAGNIVTGKISWKCKVCPFKRGTEVLKGVLLEDSLSGRIRYCLKGKGCQGDDWAPMVLLVAREGRVLSGAAHFKPNECKIGGKGKKDGIVLQKLRRRKRKVTPKPPQGAPDGGAPDAQAPALIVVPANELVDEQGEQMETEVDTPDPKAFEKNLGSWQKNMEAGAGFMESGFFERARRKFRQSIELDPTRPEAFNGIGVTYYARNDYEEALRWYKKALEVNANFGDAYYNMACIYSLQKKKDLAFRYLHIAALNGFVQPKVLQQDSDLENLRSDPRYRKILGEMHKSAR